MISRADFFKDRDGISHQRREIDDGFIEISTSNDHPVPLNVRYEARRVPDPRSPRASSDVTEHGLQTKDEFKRTKSCYVSQSAGATTLSHTSATEYYNAGKDIEG